MRNCPDGTVEAQFEGPPDAVDAMVSWAGRGPDHAVVRGVDVTELDPTGETTFAVR